MINAMVNGIFKLIISLFNTITSPVITGITSLFPALGSFFTYINTFLSYALSYVGLVLDLCFIPRPAVVFLFDYFLTCYSIYLLAISIRFVITIYNKFKI